MLVSFLYSLCVFLLSQDKIMFQHSFMCFTLFYHLFSTCLLPCLPLIVSDTNAVAKIETVWHEKNMLVIHALVN
jgi:ATP/ADP translocase